MRRGIFWPRLLDEARDLPDGPFLLARRACTGKRPHALAGDDAVAAHLVGRNGRHGDDRGAAVLARDLRHAHAHLAIRHEVVAEKHEEGLVTDGVSGAEHRMAETARVVLVGELDGKRARLVNLVGLGVLAARAKQVLKGIVNGEVLLDLRLLVGVDNHDAVNTIGFERLFDDVLNDGLVEYRQELLGERLRGGEEAGSETRGGNDCLHMVGPFFFRSDTRVRARKNRSNHTLRPWASIRESR